MQQETTSTSSWPALGSGAGLRTIHYPVILKEWPRMDWFEAISENYMDSGGRPIYVLEEVRKRYPVALHGVSLSIGSTDSLNERYLERLKTLCNRIQPAIVSDHLCWSGVEGENLHDLLPLPFTEEAISHIVSRVNQVQEFLGRRILLENVSSYVTYKHSDMTEWEFISEIAKRSGCGILLDLNNIYVNSINHSFDPYAYVRSIPREFVGQFHLGGHTDMGNYLFDTHSAPVIDPVWKLYEEALRIFGPISTLIEWDEAIPPFERLSEEATRARAIQNQICGLKSKDTLSKKRMNRVISLDTEQKPSLLEIQKLMQSHIHDMNKRSDTKHLEHFLNPQGGEAGIARMSVYAAGYVARTHDGLHEAYEAVRHVMNSDEFYDLACAYTARYPSQDYNLSFIGKHLPEFLKTSPLVKRYPFLPELAELEWLVVEAFHAFDQEPFNPKQLEGLPIEDWERVKFTFQPSLHLMESKWPILDLWKERKNEKERPTLSLKESLEYLLISRRGFQVNSEAISGLEHSVLTKLIAGASLGEALESLKDVSPENIPITQWFASWAQSGFLVDCQTSPAVKV